jgi:hypothetical protein
MRFDISERSALAEIDGRRATRSSGPHFTRLAEVGGLLSYGARVGVYTNAESDVGRVLKRAAPGGLPQQTAEQVGSCGQSGDHSSARPRQQPTTDEVLEAPGAPCDSAGWLCRRSFWVTPQRRARDRACRSESLHAAVREGCESGVPRGQSNLLEFLSMAGRVI